MNKGEEEEEKGSEKIKSKKECEEGRVGVLWAKEDISGKRTRIE